MSERQWEKFIPDDCGGWKNVGDLKTDAEVLAEMGGERMWYCYSLGSVRFSPRPSCKTDDRCGWVWIVKETTVPFMKQPVDE